MSSQRVLVLAVAVLAVSVVAVGPALAHTNEVSADSQVSSDGTVTAETVFVLTDSWLVVHGDANGDIGKPLGHTAVKPEGLLTDVAVPVDDSVWSNWSGHRRVHLVLHNDDGDGQFDPEDDPILTTGGTPAATTITVASGDQPAYVSAEGFDFVRTNGSVRVRRVAMPTDGFLVLEIPDGNVTAGAVSLNASSYENVSVRIDETVYRRQPEEFRLTLELYSDDGDGKFDDADQPVQAGNQQVGTTITLKRTDERTPTPGEPTSTPTDDARTNGSQSQDGHEHDHEDDSEHEHGDDGKTKTPEGDGHEQHGDGAETGENGHGEGKETSTPASDSPTATPTGTAVPTPGGTDAEGTATETDGDQTETRSNGTPGAGGSGFGVAAVVVALSLIGWRLHGHGP